MNNYEVTDKVTSTGAVPIRITEGKFKDVEYYYGGVSVEESGENATLEFDYDIVAGSPSDIDEFKTLMGDILLDILSKQLSSNEVIYRGGVDES